MGLKGSLFKTVLRKRKEFFGQIPVQFITHFYSYYSVVSGFPLGPVALVGWLPLWAVALMGWMPLWAVSP